MVLGIIRNLLLLLLLLLWRRWPLDLLDVGRLVLRRALRVWVLWRGVVSLCRAL